MSGIPVTINAGSNKGVLLGMQFFPKKIPREARFMQFLFPRRNPNCCSSGYSKNTKTKFVLGCRCLPKIRPMH